ncbi:hypothetical protein BDV96DRAFT_683351 [Lophiotrema nucula]|uniref:Uncharacterized protein n=1 Tax=Lophiotrema nucula TaxID=690887 RepID=A0A6A5ZNG4_9PLEO|nr:hypothetical protein BDV96DRAFT_683351 [Lophiotrema nucula]
MRLLHGAAQWCILIHLSLSLYIPSSYKPLKREFTNANIEDRINDGDAFWREELLETIATVRLLATYALRVPPDHPFVQEWFLDNSFVDLRNRIFQEIIGIIDNPPPHFRFIRTPQQETGTHAVTLAGRWADGLYPELDGTNRRGGVIHLFPEFWAANETFRDIPLIPPSEGRMDRDLNTRASTLLHEMVHLASFLLNIDLAAEGFTQPFIDIVNDRVEDGTGAPEQTDLVADPNGRLVDDIVPEDYLVAGNQQDDRPRQWLAEIRPPNEPSPPPAYDTVRMRIMLHQVHGTQMAAWNADNYAGFAMAAFRDRPIPAFNPSDPYGDLDEALEFAANVEEPPSPNIRAGEGDPAINFELGDIAVRFMLRATEMWVGYDQLGKDFTKPF